MHQRAQVTLPTTPPKVSCAALAGIRWCLVRRRLIEAVGTCPRWTTMPYFAGSTVLRRSTLQHEPHGPGLDVMTARTSVMQSSALRLEACRR